MVDKACAYPSTSAAGQSFQARGKTTKDLNDLLDAKVLGGDPAGLPPVSRAHSVFIFRLAYLNHLGQCDVGLLGTCRPAVVCCTQMCIWNP